MQYTLHKVVTFGGFNHVALLRRSHSAQPFVASDEPCVHVIFPKACPDGYARVCVMLPAALARMPACASAAIPYLHDSDLASCHLPRSVRTPAPAHESCMHSRPKPMVHRLQDADR